MDRKKEMHMQRRGKLLIALVVSLVLVFALAAVASAATVTVAADGSGDYTEIQEAIDALYNSGSLTNHTITVKAGTYVRFEVHKGMDGLTVQAADGAKVIIPVMDGSARISSVALKGQDYGGVRINNAGNVVLDGLTFEGGTSTALWSSAAIALSNGQTTMQLDNGFAVKNCTFNGSGDGFGLFVDNKVDVWSMVGCTINNLDQGIYFENSSSSFTDVTISGNTFQECAFAIHGSYGGVASESGTFRFTNNQVIGTESLRSKVIVQDTDDSDKTVFTVSGNTITDGIIGTVNVMTSDIANDVLADNTWNGSSHYVDAIEPGTIELYATYEIPDGAHGYWNLNDGGSLSEGVHNPEGTVEFVQAAIDEANAKGSRELVITGIDEDNLIRTFTWFKDALYWEIYENTGDLAITKKVPAEQIAANESYEITVALTKNGEPFNSESYYTLEINGDEQRVTPGWVNGAYVGDGKFTFTLAKDETGTIKGLPAGVKYAVTEEDPGMYTVTVTNGEGQITKNGVKQVTVSNLYEEAIAPPQTGDDSHALLWAFVLMAAGMLLVVNTRKRGFNR